LFGTPQSGREAENRAHGPTTRSEVGGRCQPGNAATRTFSPPEQVGSALHNSLLKQAFIGNATLWGSNLAAIPPPSVLGGIRSGTFASLPSHAPER
jgi:hypothetical protein